jgi:hypothetical protein
MLKTVNLLKIIGFWCLIIGVLLVIIFIAVGFILKPWGYKALLKQRDKNFSRRIKKEEKKVQKIKNEPHANSSSAELSKRVENIKKSIQEKGIKKEQKEPIPLESGKEETSLLDSGNTETTMLSTGEEETSLLDANQAPTGELGEAETTALAATDDDETGFLGTNNIADSFKTKGSEEKQETLKKTRQFVVDDEEFYNAN